MTESEIIRVKRCAELAKRAMCLHKYDLAHRLVNEVPNPWGAGMKLLIIEHEVGFRRSQNGHGLST
jgi:hypothetical protein